MPTEFSNPKRSVCSKDVQQQSKKNSGCSVDEGMDLLGYVFVVFQQIGTLKIQLLKQDNNETAPVNFAQCNIEYEIYPEAGTNLFFAEDTYSRDYSQIVSCFRHLTEYDILQTFLSLKDFKKSEKAVDQNTDGIGCKVFFDERYQKNFLLLNQ